MKNQYYIALVALAVLLVGTVVLLPEKRGENGSQGAAESSRSSLPMKSTRHSETVPQSENFLPLAAGEARRRQAERHAAGTMEVFGRTFILPVRDQEATAGSHATPVVAVAVAAEAPVSPVQSQERSAQSTVLAAQVIAHRQGRVEFMKRRTEELSSHTPGCTCAHHLGRK